MNTLLLLATMFSRVAILSYDHIKEMHYELSPLVFEEVMDTFRGQPICWHGRVLSITGNNVLVGMDNDVVYDVQLTVDNHQELRWLKLGQEVDFTGNIAYVQRSSEFVSIHIDMGVIL